MASISCSHCTQELMIDASSLLQHQHALTHSSSLSLLHTLAYFIWLDILPVTIQEAGTLNAHHQRC